MQIQRESQLLRRENTPLLSCSRHDLALASSPPPSFPRTLDCPWGHHRLSSSPKTPPPLLVPPWNQKGMICFLWAFSFRPAGNRRSAQTTEWKVGAAATKKNK